MRSINTIEVQRWSEPVNGRVKQLGMITAGQAFEAVESHLESVGLVPEDYFELAFGIKKDAELPNYRTAACYANWGSNEGICLTITLLSWNEAEQRTEAFPFASGKVLGESGDDFLRMSRIAAECSIMLNGGGMHMKVNDDGPSEALRPGPKTQPI